MLKKKFDTNIQKNFKTSFYYFGASFFQLIVSLATSPIYATYLEASDFGLIAFFGSFKAFFFPFFSFSFYSFYMMNYFKQSEAENKKTLASLLLFLSLSNVAVSVIAFMGMVIYFYVLNVNYPVIPFAIFILLELLFEMYKTFLLVDFRIKKDGKKYFLISLLKVVLNLAFCMSFVVGFNLGAVGRMGGLTLSSFVVGAVSVFYIRNFLRGYWQMDKGVVKAAFRRTYPLVLASLLYFPIKNIDYIYLERLGNVTEFGIYSIGLRISGYLQVMITAVTQAFEPDIFRFVANQNRKKLYNYIGLLMIIVAGILVGFGIFSEFIIDILTAGRYTAGARYANLNLIPIFTATLYAILNKVLIAQGRTKTILIIEVIGGLSSLILIKIFINYWQFSGALIAKGLIGLLLGILALFFIKMYRFNPLTQDRNVK